MKIYDEIFEVEDLDCVAQHMDFEVSRLNHSVLATSYVAFMQFKDIGDRAPAFFFQQVVFFQ